MKIIFPVFACLFLSGCLQLAFKDENVSVKPNQLADGYNVKTSSATTVEVSKVEQTKQSEVEAQNEKFKIVPEEFKQIDFKNFLYPYKFSNGKKSITLKGGEYEYDFTDDRGWFSLSDVYYTDLTNDGNPEAIVFLSHVSCGVSCDGGSRLFYIYTVQQNKLKSVWKYGTGSQGYGCSLKSFTVKNRKITIELFGQCVGRTENYSGVKFQVEGTTKLILTFDGKRIAEDKKEFTFASERSVINYQPEISISE